MAIPHLRHKKTRSNLPKSTHESHGDDITMVSASKITNPVIQTESNKLNPADSSPLQKNFADVLSESISEPNQWQTPSYHKTKIAQKTGNSSGSNLQASSFKTIKPKAVEFYVGQLAAETTIESIQDHLKSLSLEPLAVKLLVPTWAEGKVKSTQI
jgi:flagellar hook-basal body complex protein FliE